jgi:hypothetical protein
VPLLPAARAIFELIPKILTSSLPTGKAEGLTFCQFIPVLVVFNTMLFPQVQAQFELEVEETETN